ncbi:DegT/DnrJ/EryC1/StrS family aminotransferase [Daejeonella sp. JGW-45]|uniref:DegT/DnrJ/EryC1/StrS family aminotransferase n=1 Tax=Daejeonella sp. JGW-45 TaxID=3034148 RepID=UPI0023ED5439|nr:DegT/DnrJ/EryC1/StrS family aminotransferase [Daejeonella sp. JGW-45]
MKFIPLSSPDIRQADIDAVTEVLMSGMLVQGINVNKFEDSFCRVTGSKSAIAVSNGTATMHLALIALGIGKGDEVIVPAFSYIATANVVELVGATPVFVDIDLATFNIDVSKIEHNISKKTKAIIPVHEFGLACDIEKVMHIANKYNLHVIEDAACALGATQNNKSVGTFGTFGSFSFHPRKAISSGEGGIVSVQDSILDRKIRILRNHGIEYVDGSMEFVEAGFNYRMTDFQAALVASQMTRFNEILTTKRSLVDGYYSLINCNRVSLPTVPYDRPHTWQTFHVLINESINRDKLIQAMKDNGIGTNYGAQCIPAQKYYYKKYRLNSGEDYPNAWKAYKTGLALPIYEKLNSGQIEYISEIINKLTK